MLLSELTVTCGYSILGFHSRRIHTGRQALERMPKETVGMETLVVSPVPSLCSVHSHILKSLRMKSFFLFFSRSLFLLLAVGEDIFLLVKVCLSISLFF